MSKKRFEDQRGIYPTSTPPPCRTIATNEGIMLKLRGASKYGLGGGGLLDQLSVWAAPEGYLQFYCTLILVSVPIYKQDQFKVLPFSPMHCFMVIAQHSHSDIIELMPGETEIGDVKWTSIKALVCVCEYLCNLGC